MREVRRSRVCEVKPERGAGVNGASIDARSSRLTQGRVAV